MPENFYTEWLYQGPFSFQTQGNDPNRPVTCFLQVLTGTRTDEREGEAPHLLIIDHPLPLRFATIAEQLMGYFHLNPKDPSHVILLHTSPGSALFRHMFVQCTPEWQQQNDGTWIIPPTSWWGKRQWSEQRVSAAKEAAYTALLHPPIRLTLHHGDPLADGGPITVAEVREGIRLVWNPRGACILPPHQQVPNYLALAGGYTPCFATANDAFRFLQESQPHERVIEPGGISGKETTGREVQALGRSERQTEERQIV